MVIMCAIFRLFFLWQANAVGHRWSAAHCCRQPQSLTTFGGFGSTEAQCSGHGGAGRGRCVHHWTNDQEGKHCNFALTANFLMTFPIIFWLRYWEICLFSILHIDIIFCRSCTNFCREICRKHFCRSKKVPPLFIFPAYSFYQFGEELQNCHQVVFTCSTIYHFIHFWLELFSHFLCAALLDEDPTDIIYKDHVKDHLDSMGLGENTKYHLERQTIMCSATIPQRYFTFVSFCLLC